MWISTFWRNSQTVVRRQFSTMLAQEFLNRMRRSSNATKLTCGPLNWARDKLSALIFTGTSIPMSTRLTILQRIDT